MDAGVDARERDQRREREERHLRQRSQPGKQGRTGEARGRVTRREAVAVGHVDQGARIMESVGRPLATDRLPQPVRGPARGQIARQDEQEDRRTSPQHRREHRYDEPDQPGAAEMRESDEQVVEPVRPMVDDPALEPCVEGRQAGTSCFVDSINCCGLNGLPMKPCAPLEVAVFSDCSSTLPLNMITGIAPTPWRSCTR